MSVMPKYLATHNKKGFCFFLHLNLSAALSGDDMRRHMRPAAAGCVHHVQVVRQKKTNSTAKMKAKDSQHVSKRCAQAHWGKDTAQESVSGISLYRQRLISSVNDWWRLQVLCWNMTMYFTFMSFLEGCSSRLHGDAPLRLPSRRLKIAVELKPFDFASFTH